MYTVACIVHLDNRAIGAVFDVGQIKRIDMNHVKPTADPKACTAIQSGRVPRKTSQCSGIEWGKGVVIVHCTNA
jgi:hypothetical protein